MKYIAWTISTLFFYVGCGIAKLFEKHDWEWTYDLYIWLMHHSLQWNTRYGLNVWVTVDEDE